MDVTIFNHMVEQIALDRVFQALADPTRRALLAQLAEGERRVSDLAAPHDLTLAAVSKHLRTLERAGLLRRRVEGRTHFCRLEPAALGDAHEWLSFYEQFWNTRLDALEKLFTLETPPRRKQP